MTSALQLRLFQSDKAPPAQLKSTWAAHCAKCHCASSGSNPGKRSHHTGRTLATIFSVKKLLSAGPSCWPDFVQILSQRKIWRQSVHCTGSISTNAQCALQCITRRTVEVCRSNITGGQVDTGVQTLPAGARYILVHYFRLYSAQCTLHVVHFQTQHKLNAQDVPGLAVSK